MFNLTICCHQKERRQQILRCIQYFEEFKVVEDYTICDILLIDTEAVANCLDKIYTISKQCPGVILVLFAKDASSLLDIVGLSIYQYIIYEQ